MLKRTPLYEAHRKLGGRLIEFGGWEMPVQYSGIVDEHKAVRRAAGLFDISHMGEFLVYGDSARPFLNRVLTNDIARLEPGTGQYTMMCNETGGVVDDLYAYRLGEKNFLLVVNAAQIEADFQWLEDQLHEMPEFEGLHLVNASQKYAAVAVQGPKVARFINNCFEGKPVGGQPGASTPSDLRKNQVFQIDWAGNSLWISRTGYTGEDGFEVIAVESVIEAVWNHILAAGNAYGLKPAGLGCRDTLRLEACFPLYGHELTATTTPLEAGLGIFVALDKPRFLGRAALLRQKEEGLQRKCIAFKMTAKSAPPRPGYAIYAPEGREPIGEVVSGSLSPSVQVGIGMGYVKIDHARPGTPVLIEIRNRRHPAEIVRKPIYRKAD